MVLHRGGRHRGVCSCASWSHAIGDIRGEDVDIGDETVDDDLDDEGLVTSDGGGVHNAKPRVALPRKTGLLPRVREGI